MSTPTTNEEAESQEQARQDRKSRRVGLLGFMVMRCIFKTVRVHLVNGERMETDGKGAVFVAWHGRSLIPANLFMGKGYWALISLSRDGEIQNNIFQRFGFQTIRGSTGRGGVKAALQMARKLKEGEVLAFTPDGPRGPTHKCQEGVILMAEKSGAPIIPICASAKRRWLIKSWDRYMIPKPFTSVFVVLGEPIPVPANLGETGRAEYAERVEIAINRAEKQAESLAGHHDYSAEWRTE